MPDPRDWVSRIRALDPPDLWQEAEARAERAGAPPERSPFAGGGTAVPAAPRRAALITGVAAGILALTLVFVGLRGQPTGEDGPTPEPSGLVATHRLLERLLSDLWVLEAKRGELQGELEVGQEELDSLLERAGPDPTEAQLLEIRNWEELIQGWTRSIAAHTAEISQLRERVEQVRERRAQFLPPGNAETFPDVATVTCDGDGTGGTHLSTPVVRARSDGVHLRVVNRISNEPVFLVVEPDPRRTIAAGATEEVVLEDRSPRDIEIVCTYEHRGFGWERPSHPLWVAPAAPDGSTTSPTPPVPLVDPITLTASLDEPGVTWTEVAFLPAGDPEGELGIQPCYHCGDQQLPTAIAVDADGGFWIADRYKRRVAHFDAGGSFLEAFPSPTGPADLTFVGDRLFVLLSEGGSKVALLQAGGLAEPITVNHQGRPLHVQALIGGQDELLVLVSGATQLLGGYWAFATVDPTTGQVTPSSGVRSTGDARVDFQPLLDAPPGDFQIRWYTTGTGLVAAQDVRFQLVRDGRELRTTAGDTYLRISTRRGVATIVGISDLRGAARGLWYLEITPEGGPPLFERIADEGLGGTANNRRYLTVGPGGDVYLMRLFEDGVRVYRR